MPGLKIKYNEVCCICGACKKDGVRMGRYDGEVYCGRHLTQMRRYGEVIHKEKVRNIVEDCCVCGEKGRYIFKHNGKSYCKKHYLQMYRHGKILEHTIYEANEYVDYKEEGYTECILKNKDFEEVGRALIDLDDKEIISKYKVYQRNCSKKPYAMVNLKNGEKVFLHRLLCGLYGQKYTLDCVVDHINGNTLDNRKSNLRICKQSDNMKNIHLGDKRICGVKWLVWNQKWTATIMLNYQSMHIGNYDTFEEAVYERLKKEKELFGEYGSGASYYYVLECEDPIEEIKKIDFIKPEQKQKPYDYATNTFYGYEIETKD